MKGGAKFDAKGVAVPPVDDGGVQPMQVDALKGKGKGKDKSKSKKNDWDKDWHEKGQSNAKFEGYCREPGCGKWGHKQSDCWLRQKREREKQWWHDDGNAGSVGAVQDEASNVAAMHANGDEKV